MNRDNTYLLGNQSAKGNRPNQTSFKKGATPWNKGTKGVMHRNSGSFKRGVPSGRAVAVGTISVRTTTRDRRQRKWIKVGQQYDGHTTQGWMEYAKFLWLQRYGKLIHGDVVHHLNGKSLDDRIGNLLALPRALHPTLHAWWGLKRPTKAMRESLLARY